MKGSAGLKTVFEFAPVESLLQSYVAGLASHLQPVLAILDALYSTRAVLEKLAQQHGDLPGKWPPGVVKQLRQRHNQLSARIERHICSLANAEYYPIGELPPYLGSKMGG